MSRRPFSFPGRMDYWLICITVIGALAGCSPKIAPSMSDEDLQTCDNTVATLKENIAFPVSPYELKYKPFMTTPGEAEISSPLNGGIFPFEPLTISFTQPPSDPGVSFRILRVYVTPIDTISLSQIYHPLISLSGVISSSYQNSLEYQWTPESSGKFILLVMFRNLKNGGNPDGLPRIDFGPPSVAYVCVKISPPQAGQIVPPQPGTVQPVQNVTIMVPSFTPTSTPSTTLTQTLTITPSPTATSTITPRPPTRVPTTAVNCSAFDEKECNEHGDVCEWKPPGPTGGPGTCKVK